ncbi:hypothetical protein NP493_6g05004 [Ridgeia piscesae]|uniref:Uncharacterized protein n=1 Tax=Ridgeia piscesae TaxID=27915 RepID=A0AAD9ULQ5_RIDPI|nr:hypothetical protein NP493_6g05004 [Ridgeia piscesae]
MFLCVAERKSKKQVHYRSTPTVFTSGSASNETRRHPQKSPPASTYTYIAPEEEYCLTHPDFARSLVNDLIEDTMVDEIIPDIIEEVLRYLLQLSLKPLSEPEELWSPRTMLTFDLVDELVTELVMEEGVTVVREALRELVTDYMEMSVVEDIVDELVKGEMSDLVEKSLSEVTEEEVVDEDYIGQEVRAGALEVAVEVLQYYTDKKRTHEIKKVEQYAVKKMVDTACLDKLLSIVTGLGAVEVADEFGDRPLDDMILTILLDQYMDVYAKQKSTLDNAPLKRWHKNLVADVALDLLLDELCHSLDEDLADLDEYEISFDSR